MKVFTSDVSNNQALGAAWIVLNSSENGKKPELDLGLKEVII